MNTSCKYCVFKVMRDGKQVDCELGRIGKFKENGAEIEEEDDYLIIKHRFCTALRTIAWAKKHRNPIEKVREEIAVQCDFIIYVGAPNSFNDIQRTIRTAIAQKIKPLSKMNTGNIVFAMPAWILAQTNAKAHTMLSSTLVSRYQKPSCST
jgi:trimethylamine:corrinoid methyltransferase-like protein